MMRALKNLIKVFRFGLGRTAILIDGQGYVDPKDPGGRIISSRKFEEDELDFGD